jgi:fatty-acyl-CoA synthase
MGAPGPEASLRRNHWVSHVERHGLVQPEAAAFRFAGTTSTWSQLRDRVRALAGAMARRGVRFGDRVAVLMTNRPEFMEAILAANRLGAIAVPINFRLTATEVAYLLENSGSGLLFADTDTEALALESASRAAGHVRCVIAGIARHDRRATGAESYDSLLVERGMPPEPVDVPEDSPALIMYTSGTTGRPKGAVLTHHNIEANALSVIRAFGLCSDGDVSLIAAPMFHIGGIGSIAPFIVTGGTTVVLASGAYESSMVLDTLEREQITTVFLVPTQWQALCDDPNLSQRDLSALRVTCWGAAPASDSLLRRMAEAFPGALNVAVFGQTEMSPITCVLEGKDAIRKLGSVGKPVATVALRVVDPDMNDVLPGEIGEIVYQGPTMMKQYWQDPAATAEAFEGGWFHSGDLVRVDEDGFIYVVDRVKDMIITGGENVYSAEVENVLAAHPDILEVAVVGRPDPKWGETPVAVAVCRPGSTLDITRLRSWASRHLARYKLPTALEIVDTLPRNATGKILKGALRGAKTGWCPARSGCRRPAAGSYVERTVTARPAGRADEDQKC